MEYIYIIAIVGYYIYKTYANAKKEEQERAKKLGKTAPTTPSDPKKKSLIDQIFEEIKKSSQEHYPTSPSPTHHAPQNTQKRVVPEARRSIEKKVLKQKVSADKNVPLLGQKHKMSVNIEPLSATPDYFKTAESTKKKSKTFAGMKMSPREAIIAQIILERKF
ncbi:MAG: hypothetical protein M9887_09950 [Chitinophagales bacterium]|nr:hypothetical protein [Chitinophagales bacterium]